VNQTSDDVSTRTCDRDHTFAAAEITIAQVCGAAMKVVARATGMADEAHRLDLTVKSLLRGVRV
jgi:hypothetical protein